MRSTKQAHGTHVLHLFSSVYGGCEATGGNKTAEVRRKKRDECHKLTACPSPVEPLTLQAPPPRNGSGDVVDNGAKNILLRNVVEPNAVI